MKTPPGQVFIIHGHDQTNLLRLERLLKERYKLHPIILADAASKGLTLIEKFEAVAKDASYSVALMTPDDLVAAGTGSVAQARPNVIFELGWFYGRLGRSRVTILMKKGTQIHSDLNGIVRIEFVDKVDECIVEFERELRGAGMLVD
jgi:predicted nucleotide-binding protein